MVNFRIKEELFRVPLLWAANIVTKAGHEGMIRNDLHVSNILKDITAFRGRCGTLLDFDWISIPLVYTQVLLWHFRILSSVCGTISISVGRDYSSLYVFRDVSDWKTNNSEKPRHRFIFSNFIRIRIFLLHGLGQSS